MSFPFGSLTSSRRTCDELGLCQFQAGGKRCADCKPTLRGHTRRDGRPVSKAFAPGVIEHYRRKRRPLARALALAFQGGVFLALMFILGFVWLVLTGGLFA
jgi:hypothetical protein